MKEVRPQSLWRAAPAWRYLVAGSALCLGLGWVGGPWRDAAQLTEAPAPATFDATVGQQSKPAQITSSQVQSPSAVTASAGQDGGSDPIPASQSAPQLPSAARTTNGGATVAQAFSAVTWAVSKQPPLPILISGGGLTASASSGGTYTAMASLGVAEGRHYLELTLSVPPGQSGPSTWGGVGVVPTASLQHGMVFMPSIRAGLAVPVAGRGRQFRDGDVVMLAVDMERRQAFWGVNGEWMNGLPGAQGGEALSGAAGEQWTPFVNVTGASNNPARSDGGERWNANFGSKPFRYAIPGGFNSYGSTAAMSRSAMAVQTAGTTAAAAAPRQPMDATLMGQHVQGRIAIQGRGIPLPAGDWTVLAHFKDSGRGDTVVLGRLEGRNLRGMVAINARQFNAGQPQRGLEFKPCERQDYVFKKVDTYAANGEQRCWWISHASDVWQNQPVFQAAQLELTRLGSAMPRVMLDVGFRRADDKGFATAFYYFDPTEDSISSTPGAWADSEWHRSRIDQDPARRAYVQKIQQWGEGWAGIFFASR